MTNPDSVFYARSNGVPAEGIRDQYADSKAAKVFEIFINDKRSRTDNYCTFLVDLLRKNNCKRILDVACGTGVDSVMLIEEGFDVVSCEASDKMLKYAFKERWSRRNELAFDNWNIEQANWLTVNDNIKPLIGDGFDAVICLGNTFAHMMDAHGDQRDHKRAIKNFERCLKPGGLLLIDHRNYDNIMESGVTPVKNIYYNCSHTTEIVTSVLYTAGKPTMITMDYLIEDGNDLNDFRLSYYPHILKNFTKMLKDVFSAGSVHEIYGDFRPLDQVENAAFYIHLIKKEM